MEKQVKRFALKVSLLLLVALLVISALAVIASMGLYNRTRELALNEAKQRQTLLAATTARGIEAFYQSILIDLGWSLNDDQETLTAEPLPLTGRNRELPPILAKLAFPRLWQQLQGRVSHLFVVDCNTWKVMEPVKYHEGFIPPQEIVDANREMLQRVKQPMVSDFIRTSTGGLSLVCRPFARGDSRMLVVAVPGAIIHKRFLDEFDGRQLATATLVEEQGGELVIIASSDNRELKSSATRPSGSMGERALSLAQYYRNRNETEGTEIFDKAMSVGGVSLSPGIVTRESVLLPGRKWSLLLDSPVGAVDSMVKNIFTRTLTLAMIVIVAITGTLGFVAFIIIRERVKSQRMLNRELAHARQIQLNWLPDRNLKHPSLDIAADNVPASHISGDFYNWFDLPDGRVAVIIGDVTGHGMSAAFLMSTTQLLVRTTLLRVGDPGKCLDEVNHQLCSQVFNGQFVTIVVMVLDIKHHRLEIAAAGHPAPLISDGESFQPLGIESDLVLGVEPDARYRTQAAILPRSCSLVLYTDGVVDARSPRGERFTADRLRRALYGKFNSASEIIDRIIEGVDHFKADHRLEDDLTMVAVCTTIAHPPANIAARPPVKVQPIPSAK